MSDWDAVVIGAGPAGALTARGLALRGASVLLLERAAWPRWKVCGACLGPAAWGVLRRAGLSELRSRPGVEPIREMVLHARGRSARLRPEGWAAWARASLDDALVREAVRAGVVCRTESPARIGPVVGDRRLVHARTDGRERTLTASVVVDASGLGGAGGGGPRGRTAVGASRRVGPPARPAPRNHAPRSHVGLGALYPAAASDMPAGALHMIVKPGGYVGLVRLEDGTLDVAAAVDPSLVRGARPADVIAELLAGEGPALGGDPIEGWRGTPPLTRSAARAAEARLFRVGDALSYVEPFTGEGIGWALTGAHDLVPLAARALERWDDAYAHAWTCDRRRATPRSHRLCRVTARALRHDRLMGAAVGAVARMPSLARPWLGRAGRP